ncbi:MAG: beta-ketoacyl synthase chain length factor [Pseudomonadota bacterium]
MKPLTVHAVGCCLPGLDGWAAAKPVLAGQASYVHDEIGTAASELLPPNERRRSTASVRLAFRAAEDAVKNAALKPADWATVFASSDADTAIINRIVTALAEPQRVVSPTDFHNCVHNAAAGYWSIGVGCRLPSTTLSAWDESFAAGLLEAATLVHADGLPVLLVVYDMVPPEPLLSARPITRPGAVALALSDGAMAMPALARIELTLGVRGDETPCKDQALDALRQTNPAARALPLLALLAGEAAGTVRLPAIGELLEVRRVA